MREDRTIRADRSDVNGPANRWLVLTVICAALSIVVIDVTVLHVATPTITEDLEPSAVQLLWIVDMYPLVVAPLLVASGTLGDRIGRKLMLVSGTVVFGAASLFAALAWSPGSLIAARAVLGVGGAMIMPATMAIIRDIFRDRAERVRAVGIWSATLAAGAAAGPVLGGFLVEHFGWASVFYVNIPIVLLVLPFAIRILPESKAAFPPPWDTLSVVLAGAGILGLAFGIKHVFRYAFPDVLGLVVLLAGLVLLAVFVRRQLRRPDPLLDVRLFKERIFAISVLCVLLVMFGLVGLELLLAQYLQLVLGLEPLAAGIRLLPISLATIAGSLLAARTLRRFGTHLTIAGGLGVAALSLLPMLALGVGDQYLLLVPSFILLGFSLEIALVAANDTIISAVPPDRAGGAAAIEETAYELGGGLGVAVLGSVFAATYSRTLDGDGVPPDLLASARESLGRAVESAAVLPVDLGNRLLGEARDAFVTGLHATVLLSFALLAAAAALAAFLLRGSSHLASIEVEVRGEPD